MNLFDISSYDYLAPPDLIAQNPADGRDSSRMMRVRRAQEEIGHTRFSALPSILRAGDVLVMNDTRVFKARVPAKKIPGGAEVEIFFLEPMPDANTWRALVRPGRKLPPGTAAQTGGGVIEITGNGDDGSRIVKLPDETDADAFFNLHGQIPLPPYIKRSYAPDGRYQTVYSDPAKNRSVAAPTAGLHFTAGILDKLRDNGVSVKFLTLDVGVGTFRPVKSYDIREHSMHSERCFLSEECADSINAAKSAGRRIIAVGTTVVRTLESFAGDSGRLSYGSKDTNIFIMPGYRFKVPDSIITNFHLPKSTLLMLVAAFAGHDLTMRAYSAAVERRYRLFSYGDVMIIE